VSESAGAGAVSEAAGAAVGNGALGRRSWAETPRREGALNGAGPSHMPRANHMPLAALGGGLV